jgi:hypothetical protein
MERKNRRKKEVAFAREKSSFIGRRKEQIKLMWPRHCRWPRQQAKLQPVLDSADPSDAQGSAGSRVIPEHGNEQERKSQNWIPGLRRV